MRATAVLQKCLGSVLGSMHALRSRVLLSAVEATIHGRRLTLIDLARAWPHAERVRAPLKAMDRLLGNRLLHAERGAIYAALSRWLARHKRPVIVIDWSDLKSDGSWHLLRAAIPVGGRTLPILDRVFAAGQQGSPKAEKQFLRRLAEVLPADARPVLVTDAGFRGPWFRAVEAMGWQWLGRLRNTTYLKPADVPDAPSQWVACKALYELATRLPCDLGAMDGIQEALHQGAVDGLADAPAQAIVGVGDIRGRRLHLQQVAQGVVLVGRAARAGQAAVRGIAVRHAVVGRQLVIGVVSGHRLTIDAHCHARKCSSRSNP